MLPEVRPTHEKIIAALARWTRVRSLSPQEDLSSERLELFRNAQRLAYRCTTEISALMKEGWSERRTSDLMDTFLQDHGVRSFFHRSFAWYGDRTRFQNFSKYAHFMPSERSYSLHDVVILDTAPILQGAVADVGYTMCRLPTTEFNQALKFLSDMRTKIPAYFNSGLSTREIWATVDAEIKTHQYSNCHQQYPFSVLGHRVHQVPLSFLPSIVGPFGWHSYWALFTRGLSPELLTPDREGSARGLWAIEPHIGAHGFGAKFEEILVVDDDGARWLDDEVPHA